MNIAETGYQYAAYNRYGDYINENTVNADKTSSDCTSTYINSTKRNNDCFVYSSTAANAYQHYGNGYVPNITVDPEYLAKAENDPELKAKYLSDIEDIKQADMMFSKQQSANGVRIISQGWYIDKNGEIGSWVITKTEKGNEKSLLQRMNENLDKIRTKKAKKKIEEEKRKIAMQKRKIENEKKLLALKKKKKAGVAGKMLCNYA